MLSILYGAWWKKWCCTLYCWPVTVVSYLNREHWSSFLYWLLIWEVKSKYTYFNNCGYRCSSASLQKIPIMHGTIVIQICQISNLFCEWILQLLKQIFSEYIFMLLCKIKQWEMPNNLKQRWNQYLNTSDKHISLMHLKAGKAGLFYRRKKQQSVYLCLNKCLCSGRF